MIFLNIETLCGIFRMAFFVVIWRFLAQPAKNCYTQEKTEGESACKRFIFPKDY